MRYYVKGLYAQKLNPNGKFFRHLTEEEKKHVTAVSHVSEDFTTAQHIDTLQALRQEKRKVWLNFEVAAKNENAAVALYTEFIRKNYDILEQENGVQHYTVLHNTKDINARWHILASMEKIGLHPIPVIMRNDAIDFVRWCIEHYPVIVIDAKSAISTWLDFLWNSFIIKSNGEPRLKVFGKNVAFTPCATRYAWFAVDSDKWEKGTSTGSILYNGNRLNIAGAKGTINALSAIERKEVIDGFSLAGFDVNRLYLSAISRKVWGLSVMNALNCTPAEQTKTIPQGGFFSA